MLDRDFQDGDYPTGTMHGRNAGMPPPPLGELRIPKNRSMGNLPAQMAATTTTTTEQLPSRARLSFDAGPSMEHDSTTKLPIMTEHEHGLGASGLRRIRQQHPLRHPTSPSTPSPQLGGFGGPPLYAPTPLSLPVSRITSVSSTRPASPELTAHEDLTRFPSESLHSFSFTHQSEEPIHSRQNVLRRSIEFMRDRPGWAANNPGLVNAQAKISGDIEAQSMMELLARGHAMPGSVEGGKVPGWPQASGPLTGPAEVDGVNPFDTAELLRSDSPEPIEKSPRGDGVDADISPDHLEPLRNGDGSAATSPWSRKSPTPGGAVEASVASIPPKAGVASSARPPPPRGGRLGLKRTYTDLAPLSLQDKLMDTLAVPYLATESAINAQLSPTFIPGAALPATQTATSATPPSAVLHAHSSRWAPAAQAIFTTDASAPWTILAANDLACLVFGVTKAEVRKVGILEVVREDRRAWLEERLRGPQLDESIGKARDTSSSSRMSNGATNNVSPAMGKGVTAQLLSKPSWRARRAQTEHSKAAKPTNKTNPNDRHHANHRSRGVLLCGDVVPIQKRNGATGAASLWVKEKRGGLVWVLEEITENVAHLELDDSGRVVAESGATSAVWGYEKGLSHLDVSRLIPEIPRKTNGRGGGVDYGAASKLQHFALRNAEEVHIPSTIEVLPDLQGLRVSSYPHIAGMMVVSASDLTITSSNAVFSAALFGRSQPDGLPVTNLIPDFDKVLDVLFRENLFEPVDGLVIPEYSFRRARALLALREGQSDAAMALLRPNGLPAKHRDGSEIKVDVQMRVVKSSNVAEVVGSDGVIEEAVEEDGIGNDSLLSRVATSAGVMYALWITYSRRLHAIGPSLGPTSSLLVPPDTPPHQPSPGQTQRASTPPDLIMDDMAVSKSNGVEVAEPIAEVVSESILSTPTPHVEPSSMVCEKPMTKAIKTPTTTTTTTIEARRKKTIDDFIILEDMGQGAYGQVKLARDKSNNSRKMVLKYVTKRRILVDTWTRDRRLGTVPLEIHVLDYLRRDGLKHPNIVEMSDFFEDDMNYYIEMVPHGLPGMDLFDYIELRVTMDESECRSIFRQVVNAVHHLHTKALVVHRDIKDENVILDGEGNIKLIDFGSATYIKNGPFDVFVGTIDYAAPEVLAGRPYGGREQDVWALGILLYTIVYKENPFYSIDEIMDHGLRVPFILSEDCIDLIRLMLNRDVEQRMGIEEVVEHGWLVEN
ncbi:MAG: hypothetical protein M1823_003177 [Watsoniomyces obsoletus]|nr:MAG: hypothetical protein M1823_003177 [Watsoniomyces obsoletus]